MIYIARNIILYVDHFPSLSSRPSKPSQFSYRNTLLSLSQAFIQDTYIHNDSAAF